MKFNVNDTVKVLVNGKHWLRGNIIEIQDEILTINIPLHYSELPIMTVQEHVENVRAVAETLEQRKKMLEQGYRL